MNKGLERFKAIYKTTKKYDIVEIEKMVRATLSKETFLEYIFQYFKKDDLLDEVDFSNFTIALGCDSLSDNEFQQLHPDYHYNALWDTLSKQGFSPIDASNPVKWLSITIQMVMNNNIKSTCLAMNKKNGRDEILEALNYFNDGDESKLLEVAKAIKRNLYGFIQVRAKKGLYQSQPIARAWWILYLSKEISKQTKIKEKTISEYLLDNKTNFDELIMRMSSKLTVIADKNIRDGFFKFLIDKKVTNTNDFKEVIRKIGIESSWRAMGSLDINDNKKIIESLVA